MKKLLAIAVAAALVAPAAAMADTTLYGKLHASVGAVKTTTGGVTTSRNVVESHASRFGIKGATALDNGMEATYGLEYGIDLDGDGTAGRNPSARNTFVGLKGGFGEVRVGRHDTPAKLATAGQDVFADTYGDMLRIITTDNDRVDNAVAYINKFGPVGFAAAHSTGTGVTGVPLVPGDDANSTQNNANTFMVNYGNGPWYAGLGHTAIQNAVKKTNLGLGYKAEAGHQVNLVMENSKVAGTNVKTKAALVNGVYKMGNVSLKAQYGESKLTGAGKEKLTSVGVDYNLGKKTSVYLLASENKNDAKVLNGTDKVRATAVGLVTEF
jgi:predicted porin